MKRIILLASIGIISVSSLTSCKKAYTCDCVDSRGKEKTQTVLAVTRSEAQKNCDEFGLLGHCKIQ